MGLEDYKKDDSEKATEKKKKWLLLCATRPEWNELKKNIIPSDLAILRQIGIGMKRARSMAPPLLESLKSEIQGVIHFGLSGALQKNMKEGDIILPTQIINDSGETISPSPKLLAQAQELLLNYFHLPFSAGKLFTTEKALETPEEKQEAGNKWNAITVDMESFPYAKRCAEKNIPYLSIRAIFDPLEWNLRLPGEASSEGLLHEDGNLNARFILKEVLKKPRLLMAFPRYQRAASKGNKALAQFLLKFLQEKDRPD